MVKTETNETNAPKTGSETPSSAGLALLDSMTVQINPSVEAFIAALAPVKAAFKKTGNVFKRKQPVNKISDTRYEFDIGNLGRKGWVKSPADGVRLLAQLEAAARDDSDTEFRALIVKHYPVTEAKAATTPAT